MVASEETGPQGGLALPANSTDALVNHAVLASLESNPYAILLVLMVCLLARCGPAVIALPRTVVDVDISNSINVMFLLRKKINVMLDSLYYYIGFCHP
jgi:hypothetical protein